MLQKQGSGIGLVLLCRYGFEEDKMTNQCVAQVLLLMIISSVAIALYLEAKNKEKCFADIVANSVLIFVWEILGLLVLSLIKVAIGV